MPEHSSEPWSTKPYSGPSVTFAMSITHGDGSGCVALFCGDTEEQAIANGDRTMDCVNAMAGVSDPERLMELVRYAAERRGFQLCNEFNEHNDWFAEVRIALGEKP